MANGIIDLMIASSITQKLTEEEIDSILELVKFKEEQLLNKVKNIPNKSLESTGLDLCGYSQDDVWERAIDWFKEQITELQ